MANAPAVDSRDSRCLRCLRLSTCVIGLLAFASGLFAQTNLPVAQLREEMRIVSNDSSLGTSLTAVMTGTVLRDGRILTVHMREAAVRVFDANGRFLSMLGHVGDGPGEFRMPYVVGTVGDSIWVFDASRRRYTLYGPDFKSLGNANAPPRGQIAWFGLGSARTMIARGPGDTAKAGIFSANGELIRTIDFEFKGYNIRRFALHDPGVAGTTTAGSGRGRGASTAIDSSTLMVGSPLDVANSLQRSRDGRDVFAFEPGEVWGGRPGQFRFSSVSIATGQLSSPVVVSMTARRVSPAERDSLINERAKDNPRTEAEYRRQARVPEYYPAYSSVELMGDGLIWIAEDWRRQERVVMDTGGRLLLRLRLPTSLVVFAATRTHVWGVVRDSNDLPIILRYRILP